MRLLADANVLLDYLLRRPGYGEDIRDLFVMGFYGDAELWAPAKSLTDVFCVARKAIGSQAAQKNMWALLERLRVVAIDGDDVRAAAGLCSGGRASDDAAGAAGGGVEQDRSSLCGGDVVTG